MSPEGFTSALTAIERTNNLVIDNITYQCKATYLLQAQLKSFTQTEDKIQVKRNLPPSLSHVFPNPLLDSTFKTYDTSAHCVFPDISSEYHDKNFPSYDRNPATTMIFAPPSSFFPLPPGLHHREHSFVETPSTFSGSFKRVSIDRNVMMPYNTSDLIYPSNNGIIYTTISQQYFNDSHHLPRKPLASSSSSRSFYL